MGLDLVESRGSGRNGAGRVGEHMFGIGTQEILLVLAFLAALYVWEARPAGPGRAVAMASILGLAIGIHPNSFVIALPYGLLHLSRIVAPREGVQKAMVQESRQRESSRIAGPSIESKPAMGRLAAFSEAALFVAVLSLFAGVFVGLSFLMDGEFLTHYRAFGADAEPTTEELIAEIESTVPLSISRAEDITALRHWADGRAVRA